MEAKGPDDSYPGGSEDRIELKVLDLARPDSQASDTLLRSRSASPLRRISPDNAHTQPDATGLGPGSSIPPANAKDMENLPGVIVHKFPNKTGIRSIFSLGVNLFILSTIVGVAMKGSSKWVMESISPWLAIQVRMFLTWLITLGILVYRKEEHYFWGPPKVRFFMMLRGMTGFINIALTYYSLQYLTLPDVAVIGFINPVLTGIAGRIFLHERYKWQQFALGLVSFVGVIIIARPPLLFGYPGGDAISITHRSLAVTACLIAAAGGTVTFLVLRHIGQSVSAMATVCNYAFFSTIGATGLMIYSGEQFLYPQDAKTWTVLLVAGLSGFLLNWLIPRALQLEEASVLTIFSPIEIVAATLTEAAIWHDWPDAWSVFGALIVVSSVLYSATFK